MKDKYIDNNMQDEQDLKYFNALLLDLIGILRDYRYGVGDKQDYDTVQEIERLLNDSGYKTD